MKILIVYVIKKIWYNNYNCICILKGYKIKNLILFLGIVLDMVLIVLMYN